MVNHFLFTVAYTQFHLLSINGLDEVSETLKTTGYLEVRWYDSYLFWNKTEYGGLWYYLFPQDDIWKPDIALKNSVGKYQPLGDDKLNLFVDADGHVIWNPFEVLYDFLVTVKAAPHECVIRTGQPQT